MPCEELEFKHKNIVINACEKCICNSNSPFYAIHNEERQNVIRIQLKRHVSSGERELFKMAPET